MQSAVTLHSRAARSRLIRTVALITTTTFALACDAHRASEPDSLVSLVVSPHVQTLSISGTQQFSALGRDDDGVAIATSPKWTVVAGGGSISAAGVFTAGTTPGTYVSTIRATIGTLSSSATITVVPGPLASIAVTSNPDTTNAGTTTQFRAVGMDMAGNVVGMEPLWSIANGGGTINDTSGLFTAGSVAGTFTNTIVATSGAISGSATVTVNAGMLATIEVTPNPVVIGIGGTQQFIATGLDSSRNQVTITPVWSVASGGGAIDPTSGRFTGGNASGTFANTVRATSGLIAGTATITIAAGELATIAVTPNPASLGIGATQQFVATGIDVSGNTVAIAPVWAVTHGGGTIVAATGFFTAGTTAGTFANTVTATSGGVTRSATVVVSAGPLATITVSPNPDTVAANSFIQFSAVGRDAAGNIVAIAPVWSVVNNGGTITSNSGLFTAGSLAGTFNNTIRATSGAITGSATAVVSPTLATITVSPDPASVETGSTQQFTATGRDGNGNTMSITPVWTVETGGGTITSNTGLFTAGATTGTFTSTVRASSGAVSGAASVTVTAIALQPTVGLGAAAPNGIIAGTAVTCVANGTIHADVSISPGILVTGFGPCVINGTQYLNDAVAAQAQLGLETTYNTLAAMPCPPANAIVANLGGTTKAAGVYCSATSIGVTGTLTLDGGGDPNATFVFQAGTTLTTAGSIVLINNAQAMNVHWLVGSSATIGVASQWQGNILSFTSITLNDNAMLHGRALARNGAVTLGTNNVITLP